MSAVAYGTWGAVRGFGPLRLDRAAAEADLQLDADGCGKHGGYSDRFVVAVDDEGICYRDLDTDDWVRASSGSAAKYDLKTLSRVLP